MLAIVCHSSVTMLHPIILWYVSHVGRLLPITQWQRFEMCRQSSGGLGELACELVCWRRGGGVARSSIASGQFNRRTKDPPWENLNYRSQL